MTFVRRADSVEPTDFSARWRAATESAVAAAGPARPRGLVHGVVRLGRSERPYHGIETAWFADAAAAAAYDAIAAPFLTDVLDSGTTVHAVVDARVVAGPELLAAWLADQNGGTRILLAGVIHRADGLTREQFADYWWNVHRPLADALLPADLQSPIYVHNYVQPGEAWPWDGVGEFYEDSLDVAKARTAWAEGPDGPRIVADEQQFLIRDTRWSVVTDATVLVPLG